MMVKNNRYSQWPTEQRAKARIQEEEDDEEWVSIGQLSIGNELKRGLCS